MKTPDVIVIGGGLVGASIAWGLVHRAPKRCFSMRAMSPFAPRAAISASSGCRARGAAARIAQWSLRSADLWGAFAAQLMDETGVDVGHERPGGMLLNLSEAEARDNAELLAELRHDAGNKPYAYELLDHDEVARRLPGIGPEVVSGSYSPYDGHANPLFLLRALHAGFEAKGGEYRPGERVEAIEHAGGATTLRTGKATYTAPKVVISAGLSTGPLARLAGINAPIMPLHGQILVTERPRRAWQCPPTWFARRARG